MIECRFCGKEPDWYTVVRTRTFILLPKYEEELNESSLMCGNVYSSFGISVCDHDYRENLYGRIHIDYVQDLSNKKRYVPSPYLLPENRRFGTNQ